MALPPVPESPRELPRKSQETPRVGMRLFQNETEDDDVSVLTFNTLNTRKNTSSYVRTIRESLERMILESKNSDDDDCNILSRISEEVASQNTSCNTKTGCDRSTSSTSLLKREEKDETDSISSDDGTISLSESILDSVDKVLSSIGSSAYYTGRKKKESSETHESPAPRPHPNRPSTMKRPTKISDAKEDEKESFSKEDLSSKESSSDKYSQLEASSNFLNSYFGDENIKPSDKNTNESKYTISTNITKNESQIEVSSNFLNSYFCDENIKASDKNTNESKYTISTNITKVGQVENEQYVLDSYFRNEHTKPSDDDNKKSKNTFATNITKVGNAENEKYLQKLESETRRLQLLLKERQLERKLANQALLMSIKKANELLDSIC